MTVRAEQTDNTVSGHIDTSMTNTDPGIPAAHTPAFSCEIAGVPCTIAYRDEQVMRYYASYHPHVLSAGFPAPAGTAASNTSAARPTPGDLVPGVALTAHVSSDGIGVPYSAAAVRRLLERNVPGADDAFAEWQLAYDPVSRAMLRFDRLTFHGACIEYGGRAYIFTAYSGTGKSTHIRLWGRYLGSSVRIVNGDKPIIDLHDVDDIAAYGSPWCGKEGWQRNVRVPLGGICILHRAQPSSAGESAAAEAGIDAALRAPGDAASGGAVPHDATSRNATPDDAASCDIMPGSTAPSNTATRNTIRRATTDESIEDLINRIYLTDDPAQAAKATELLDRLITHVPVYVLTCDMSEDAVRTSFEGLTGERYQRYEPRAVPDTPESPVS